MINVTYFLSKFSQLKAPNRFIVNAFISLLKTHNILIARESISVRNKTLYIKEAPVIKSEIFMRKEELLLELNEKISPSKIVDIR